MTISHNFLLKLGYNLTQAGGSSGGGKIRYVGEDAAIESRVHAGHIDIIEKMVSK